MAAPVVRVFSDYICPFCYVATERAAWLEERYGAQVEWLPFDLHPEYPAEGISIDELHAKYPAGLHEQVDRMIDEAGLPRGERTHVPNSRAALHVHRTRARQGSRRGVAQTPDVRVLGARPQHRRHRGSGGRGDRGG